MALYCHTLPPPPNPHLPSLWQASHKEGGGLNAANSRLFSPSLILGMLAIEMARRGRGMGVFFNRVLWVSRKWKAES